MWKNDLWFLISVLDRTVLVDKSGYNKHNYSKMALGTNHLSFICSVLFLPEPEEVYCVFDMQRQ
jgi:hypothetical protein